MENGWIVQGAHLDTATVRKRMGVVALAVPSQLGAASPSAEDSRLYTGGGVQTHPARAPSCVITSDDVTALTMSDSDFFFALLSHTPVRVPVWVCNTSPAAAQPAPRRPNAGGKPRPTTGAPCGFLSRFAASLFANRKIPVWRHQIPGENE